MNRPTLEVADIVHAAGNRFWEHHGSHLAWQHRKVLDAIVRCRTAALGGHRDRCVRCGHQAISYNSCRNRHCPRCQGNAGSRWLAEPRAELLPVSYFHIVFTLPHELSALTLQNKRLLYDLLFRASAATLLELARDPKHLGADIGFLGVLHTWGQNGLVRIRHFGLFANRRRGDMLSRCRDLLSAHCANETDAPTPTPGLSSSRLVVLETPCNQHRRIEIP